VKAGPVIEALDVVEDGCAGLFAGEEATVPRVTSHADYDSRHLVARLGSAGYLTTRSFLTSFTLGTAEASLPAADFWSEVSTKPLS